MSVFYCCVQYYCCDVCCSRRKELGKQIKSETRLYDQLSRHRFSFISRKSFINPLDKNPLFHFRRDSNSCISSTGTTRGSNKLIPVPQYQYTRTSSYILYKAPPNFELALSHHYFERLFPENHRIRILNCSSFYNIQLYMYRIIFYIKFIRLFFFWFERNNVLI